MVNVNKGGASNRNRSRLADLETAREHLLDVEENASAVYQELGIICTFEDEDGRYGTVNDSTFTPWFQRRVEELDEQIKELREDLD